MKPWNERIKDLRKEKDITQEEMAKALGLKRGTLANWERGHRLPDVNSFQMLANFFNVPLTYVVPDSESVNVAAVPKSGIGEIKMIPILGRIAAGMPIYAEQNIEGYSAIDSDLLSNGHEYFYLKVKGDSMDRIVRDGDLVLVRRQPHVENGQIAVVYVNGYDATLKRVSLHGDIVLLTPESNNHEHKPTTFKASEVHIVGRAVRYVGDIL